MSDSEREPSVGQTGDSVLDALDGLVRTLTRNAQRLEDAQERARELRQRREAGESYIEIVSDEKHPLLVELATANLSDLSEAGARFRRAEARALHDEGMTMAQIATLFGVSRQRISKLINQRD